MKDGIWKLANVLGLTLGLLMQDWFPILILALGHLIIFPLELILDEDTK